MNFLALGASIYERILTQSKWVTTEQSKMAMFGPTSGTTNFPVLGILIIINRMKKKIMCEKIQLFYRPTFHHVEKTSQCLHPRKLTWNLKITHLKGKTSSKPSFLGSMLNFGGVSKLAQPTHDWVPSLGSTHHPGCHRGPRSQGVA